MAASQLTPLKRTGFVHAQAVAFQRGTQKSADSELIFNQNVNHKSLVIHQVLVGFQEEV